MPATSATLDGRYSSKWLAHVYFSHCARPLRVNVADFKGQVQAALDGAYSIEREIGRGGMATVFLAHDEKHRRSVAIKVLRPEFAATVGPERFRREIALAAGLQHPHILPVFDSGETADGLLWFSMPYIAGQTLRELIARRFGIDLAGAPIGFNAKIPCGQKRPHRCCAFATMTATPC